MAFSKAKCAHFFLRLILVYIRPTVSKQHSVTAVYLRIANVDNGKIVPMAMLPPDFDDDAFFRAIVVPQLALLPQGMAIAYGGNYQLDPSGHHFKYFSFL